MSELKTGALLQGGKYKIEKSLGQGGFGITYLAEQTNLGRKVCIKEFFMKEYGERTAAPDEDSQETVLTSSGHPSGQMANDKDATVLTGVSAVTSAAAAIMGRYREKFVKEARTIARLDHPGIVRIHDVFEENGTAYYVMDFIEGENLNDLVKREGALPEERALGYIRQVADALSYVHGHNIMHLDVKPANIIVRKSDDKAILIDFGTAKQYDSEGTQTSTTPVGLSVGYAPIEMSKPGGVQTFSPETDIYSLGATLYYLVTGQNPPDASERMEMIMEGEKFQLPESISSSTIEVIEQSMQARKKRIQNVNGFLELLNSDGEKRRLEAEEKAAKEAEAERQEALRIEREKEEAEKKRIAKEKARAEAEAKRQEAFWKEQEKAEAEKTSKKKGWTIAGVGAAILFLIVLVLSNLDNGENDYRYADSASGNASQSTQLNNDSNNRTTTITGSINGHDYVDLGLSVRWATCNVGALFPYDYGGYYAWGEITTKSNYSWKTLKYCKDSRGSFFSKYNSDRMDRLDLSDDVAHTSFGGTWRMPTNKDFEELVANCKIIWTSINGINGCKVTSTINGNSIFLPAAGLWDGPGKSDEGIFCYYWSSSLEANSNYSQARGYDCAKCFLYSSKYKSDINCFNPRKVGYPVRPVTQ